MSAADTAWMMTSTALVLLMTPALGFFYGGLVRAKNALNTLMMSVEPTVKAILASARTGDVGDGKIFVLSVEKVYRIRTGEEDQAAVTPIDETAPVLVR